MSSKAAIKRRIIGLAGYAGSGKDTAAAGLVALGWERIAFADALRETLLAMNPYVGHLDGEWKRLALIVTAIGWDAAKKIPEVRRLLQRMGTEVGRDIFGADVWIDLAKRKIDATDANIVIADVRFANETAAIRSWGGQVVRIERPGVGPVNGHVSEALDIEHDAMLFNRGSVTDLQNCLRQFAAGTFTA